MVKQTNNLTLSWEGSEGETVIHSVEQLDELLNYLTQEAKKDLPFTAVLAQKDGSALSIGLGRDESALNYVAASLDPPYFTSLGDKNRKEPIKFVFGGEMTELEPTSAIPTEDAREALRHFFKTAKLSSKIKWQEV